MVVVSLGGLAASYNFNRSAGRGVNLAINAFDLRGDLGQLAIDLQSTNGVRTAQLQHDLASLISSADQEISDMRTNGDASPLLSRALDHSATYLDFVKRSLAPAGTKVTTVSIENVDELIDQAATQVEQAALDANSNVNLGTDATLFGVVLFVVLGFLVREQERGRRRTAVLASEEASRAQFEAMVEHSTDLLFLTDDNLKVQYCSPSALSLLGLSGDELKRLGTLESFIHPDDLDGAAAAFTAIQTKEEVGPYDLRLRHRDGGWRTLEITGNDLSATSTVKAVAWHARDVTDRRALEEQLSRQAFEDPLTGLANRALLRDRLSHVFARSSRSGGSMAVLMIDLDSFKTINDGMGHDAGDAALKEIAARISQSARPGDTVARLGGDEFVVLLEELDDVLFAEEVADRVLELIRQPLTIRDVSLRISASIGIAYSEATDATPESLLRDADVAMYASKAKGRDRWTRFEPAMHVQATQELQLSQDLAHALDRHELVVYYQPSVDLNDWSPQGVEALLRWKHPDSGLVPPDVFIPIAEHNALIVPIGRWVLEQACQQAIEWHAAYPSHPLSMSVNVSGRQLNDQSLVPDVRTILHDSGLDPSDLVLEVTESVLMSDIHVIIKKLRELKELGISIAIDDFGTGYSSLAYLRQLPIDILKIDKTFVDAASAGDPGGVAIIRAILDLSEGMQLKTIAEGIEDTGQALLLNTLGCHSAQGFLFSRPLPPAELRAFFDTSRWGAPVLATTI
jgi:diguanylate cyclase (GGDEF)-like protein/PAS domain S-box-containing protein